MPSLFIRWRKAAHQPAVGRPGLRPSVRQRVMFQRAHFSPEQFGRIVVSGRRIACGLQKRPVLSGSQPKISAAEELRMSRTRSSLLRSASSPAWCQEAADEAGQRKTDDGILKG